MEAAAPLKAGSAFCAHHAPDKFTGTQCAGIMRQVDFWSAKKQDLNSIMAQLNTDKVKKMLKIMYLAIVSLMTYLKDLGKKKEVVNGSKVNL